MQAIRFLFPMLMLLCMVTSGWAQTQENTAWLFISHTQKISEKVNFLADIQARTADDYKFVNGFLLRGAFSYAVSKNGDVGAGYAYFGQWEEEAGLKEYSREHRSFEQYQHKVKLSRKVLNLRARLEQRFMKDDNIKFSQRLRAYASLQAPLIADKEFTKGMYLKIQDEVFFNVQNKDNVNGAVFDQHRPYVAWGYRASKLLDFELGYLQLRQKEFEDTFTRHTLQIMFTTSF